jgi:hypothetical protein
MWDISGLIFVFVYLPIIVGVIVLAAVLCWLIDGLRGKGTASNEKNIKQFDGPGDSEDDGAPD